MDSNFKFKEEHLDLWGPYCRAYLLEVLNGEYFVEEAREDLLSLVMSKTYNFNYEEEFGKDE